MKHAISVTINTLNEERNIRNCLECVKWADEIVIVDMHSDDRTVEIAGEYTDRIFMHERLDFADPARQFALDQASNEWVLSVDADELVPVALCRKLLEVADSDSYDAAIVCLRNIVFGREVQGLGWGSLQCRLPRFYRKSVMTYCDRIHGFAQLDPSARTVTLMNPAWTLLHLSYIDAEHFLEKLNRYTTIEARQAHGRGERVSVRRLFVSALREFAWRYVRRKGYKDGFSGLALAGLMTSYRLTAALKLHLLNEYKPSNPRDEILLVREALARQTVEGYSQPVSALPENRGVQHAP